MKAPILNTTISAATLALASCSDPAEKTTDATVAESAPVATSSQDTTYSFTQNSAIGFVGSKVTGSHEGGFKKFSGHFVVHNGTPEAGEFTIQMDSTWSDNEKLTGHLKAPDFFDVEQFPVSTFEVTAFTRKSDQQYELSGNLTLHGETKNITFPRSPRPVTRSEYTPNSTSTGKTSASSTRASPTTSSATTWSSSSTSKPKPKPKPRPRLPAAFHGSDHRSPASKSMRLLSVHCPPFSGATYSPARCISACCNHSSQRQP